MDELIGFMTSLDDTEIDNIYIFIKTYIETRKKHRVINDILLNVEKRLTKAGCSRPEIEASKVHKLYIHGMISKEDYQSVLKELYKEEQRLLNEV